MKPEEFKHYQENEDTVLAYRGLQEAYRDARRSWEQEFEAMTPEEREITGRNALRRTEELSRKLFELPEGTHRAGRVIDTPEAESLAGGGESHQMRTLDTAYGKITIHKLDLYSGNSEYWLTYNPKESGAIVAQSLRYDGNSLLEIINDNCELNTSEALQNLLPGVYRYDVAGCIELKDVLDTMEHIARSFGIDSEGGHGAPDDEGDGEGGGGGAPDRSPRSPAPADDEGAIALEPALEEDEEFEATPALIV